MQESEDASIKYYVPINEHYDVIRIAHSNIGHRAIKYTLKEILKNVLMLPKNKLSYLFLNVMNVKLNVQNQKTHRN